MGADSGLLDAGLAENLAGVAKSVARRRQYGAPFRLEDLVAASLATSLAAIESYRELRAYLKDAEPSARCLLVAISANEEKHANAFAELLDTLARPQS